ncbi:MAG TPA: tetratricopeptide repeat protein [Gemmatimonadales bacterium]|nr:tetratricopeptide repeat protein [Gemmatimonadales bacterium]
MAFLVVGLLAGCALKSDVKKVETELATFRLESAQQDSIRAARLQAMLELQQAIMDSLSASVVATQHTISAVRGALSEDLYRIQQQLVQVQELTGQSQQRLSELRTQLENRSQEVAADTGAAVTPTNPSAPSADQMYEASLQQLRRGSVATARMGFQQLLKNYPTSPKVPDAIYFIGESWATEAPDSAARYYEQVVTGYATSTRAPGALYKLGLLAERRRDIPAARAYFSRVARDYPRSEEAALVPDKLRALGQ